ncbi:uncharacterized protein UTRI_02780_B [Ustilago trichophora]|uniref:Effector family protein Eff1 n=1 Tax=Ustilago trichophora TaxID=86804 RepID=A0A5C3E3Y3_9BASI|nr:uncharacterized protein UTRI_02780_B [Ustilago trichophora]
MVETLFLVVWLALLVSVSSQTGWTELYELEPEAVAAILNPSHSEAPTQLAEIDQGIQHIFEPHSGPHTIAHTDSSSFGTVPLQHSGWIPQHTAVPAESPSTGYGPYQHTNWNQQHIADIATFLLGEHGPLQHTSWATEPAAGPSASFHGGHGLVQHQDWSSRLAAGQPAVPHMDDTLHVHSTWSANSGIDQSEIPDMTNHGRYLQPAASRPPTDQLPQVNLFPSIRSKLAEAPSSSEPRPRPFTATRLTERIIGEIPPGPLQNEKRREILQKVIDTLKAGALKTDFEPLPYPFEEPLSHSLIQAIYPLGTRRFFELDDSTLLSRPVALSGPNLGVPKGQDPLKLLYVWKILGVTEKGAHVYRFIGLIETESLSRTRIRKLRSIEGMRGDFVRPFGEDSVIDYSQLRKMDKMYQQRKR